MRELTITEAEQAAGGMGFIGTLIVGLITAYAYQKLGGAEEIDNAIEATVDHLEDTLEDFGPPCNGSDPSLCMAG